MIVIDQQAPGKADYHYQSRLITWSRPVGSSGGNTLGAVSEPRFTGLWHSDRNCKFFVTDTQTICKSSSIHHTSYLSFLSTDTICWLSFFSTQKRVNQEKRDFVTKLRKSHANAQQCHVWTGQGGGGRVRRTKLSRPNSGRPKGPKQVVGPKAGPKGHQLEIGAQLQRAPRLLLYIYIQAGVCGE